MLFSSNEIRRMRIDLPRKEHVEGEARPMYRRGSEATVPAKRVRSEATKRGFGGGPLPRMNTPLDRACEVRGGFIWGFSPQSTPLSVAKVGGFGGRSPPQGAKRLTDERSEEGRSEATDFTAIFDEKAAFCEQFTSFTRILGYLSRFKGEIRKNIHRIIAGFTLFGSFLLYNCRMFSSYNHNSVSRVTRSSTAIIL